MIRDDQHLEQEIQRDVPDADERREDSDELPDYEEDEEEGPRPLGVRSSVVLGKRKASPVCVLLHSFNRSAHAAHSPHAAPLSFPPAQV